MTAYLAPLLFVAIAIVCLAARRTGMEISGFIGFWVFLITAAVLLNRLAANHG